MDLLLTMTKTNSGDGAKKVAENTFSCKVWWEVAAKVTKNDIISISKLDRIRSHSHTYL